MKRILAFVLALLFVVCTFAACEEQGAVTHTHTFGEWADLVAPTCISKGVCARTCACGHTETRLIDEVAHQPNEEGYGCAVCSHLHELDSTEIVVEPTCAEKGKKAYRCACGFTEYDDISATNTHNFSSGTGLCLVCGRPDIPVGVLQNSNGVRWAQDEWGVWREYDNIGTTVYYDNEQINVLCWNSISPEFVQNQDVDDAYRSSIYKRNRDVQTRLGVTLNFIEESAYSFAARVRAAHQSGTQDFDVIAAPYQAQAVLMRHGYLQNLFDIEKSYIELSKPWWPKSLAGDAAVDGSLYFVTGDISGRVAETLPCVYFNVDLVNEKYETRARQYFAENGHSEVTLMGGGLLDQFFGNGNGNSGGYGEPSQSTNSLTTAETATDWLYELAYNGKWTVDTLIELASGCYIDRTGDGKTVDDTYGITSINYKMAALYGGSGLRMIEADDAEALKISDDYTSSRAGALVAKLGTLMRSDDYHTEGTTDSSYYYRPFVNGDALFAVESFNFGARYLVNSDKIAEYGVLPMPKYDAVQADYQTVFGDSDITLFSVFRDCADRGSEQKTLTMLSAVLECWASEAYRKTTPVIWELNMILKASASCAPRVMCEMIHDSMRIDLGRVLKYVLDEDNDHPIDSLLMDAALAGTDWDTVGGDYYTQFSANLKSFVE